MRCRRQDRDAHPGGSTAVVEAVSSSKLELRLYPQRRFTPKSLRCTKDRIGAQESWSQLKVELEWLKYFFCIWKSHLLISFCLHFIIHVYIQSFFSTAHWFDLNLISDFVHFYFLYSMFFFIYFRIFFVFLHGKIWKNHTSFVALLKYSK